MFYHSESIDMHYAYKKKKIWCPLKFFLMDGLWDENLADMSAKIVFFYEAFP